MRLVGITLNRHNILYICIDDYILTITGSYISSRAAIKAAQRKGLMVTGSLYETDITS